MVIRTMTVVMAAAVVVVKGSGGTRRVCDISLFIWLLSFVCLDLVIV